MARIAGVTTQKDTRGKATNITINLKKHPEAVGALKELGLIEKSNLQKEIDVNPENYMTVEEFRQKGHDLIKENWAHWKK